MYISTPKMIDVLEKWPGDALFSIEDCGFVEFWENSENCFEKLEKNTENPEKYCQKILEKVRKISSEWNGVIATN